MTASPRTCSTENWTPVTEHGEDNESGIRTCLRQRWSHAAFPTTPGKPPRQTVPSGVVPATPVYETTKRRGAMPWGIREWDGRLSSLHQTLTHFYVTFLLCASRIGLNSHNRTHTNTDWGWDPSYRRLTPYIHTYTCLSVCLSVCLFVCTYACLLVCLSVFCLSLYFQEMQ